MAVSKGFGLKKENRSQEQHEENSAFVHEDL